MRSASVFKKYLVPGLVFQGVIIAGGYGTGRELAEYFLRFGPLGGLLGMFLITMLIWGGILAATFEVCRCFQVYDYRSLLMRLLGRFWVAFEIVYFALMLIVLAVVGSAAGILLRDNFGIPYLVGVGFMLASIGFLTFKGGKQIEKFLSGWSILIYAVYALFLAVVLWKFGHAVRDTLASPEIKPGWMVGGFKYALYNVGTIPAVLFCVRHFENRKQAVASGFLAGLIGILPAALFYVAVLGHYPAVVFEEIPAVYVLSRTGNTALLVVFQIVLFGALIETGTGFIHAVNERLSSAAAAHGREFPNWHRPLVALGLLLTGLGIASFGLIDLVAKGYGSLSWGIGLTYVLPLIFIGLPRALKRRAPPAASTGPDSMD